MAIVWPLEACRAIFYIKYNSTVLCTGVYIWSVIKVFLVIRMNIVPSNIDPDKMKLHEIYLQVNWNFIEMILMNFFIQLYCLICCLRLYMYIA